MTHVVYQLCLHTVANRPMENIQLSLAHRQYWPVNIAHHFHDWRKPKVKLNPSQQFTCQTSQTLENRAHLTQSNIHQPCSSRWSYTVFTHVQRNSIKQIKDEISWYPRPHVCLAKLTGSRGSFSLPSPSCLDGIEGRELAPEMSLPTILRAWRIRVTYVEPKLGCPWTESYKHHILGAKAALSKSSVAVPWYRQVF